MKKILSLAAMAATLVLSCTKTVDPTPDPDPKPDPTPSYEAGWPSSYEGVMLQGFYWDSFADTQWEYLESMADDIAPYFSLIWVPNSGFCDTHNNMGYLPYKFFDQTSTFGNEQQLRSMIKAYKDRGTGMIADVVINHHNSDGWFDFPKESYKGVEYQFLSTDIVKDDDNGDTARQAASQGRQISANNDTGEGWAGCRDLDHKSLNVQKICKAYVDYLKNDLGYAGFRYDMVKGYSAMYTGMYNESCKTEFSVGEYWDGNHAVVEKWIAGTKRNGAIQSAAFDFCFRYTARDAANNGSWAKLMDQTSASTDYSRYAVTFVENHDTEYRAASAPQDPVKKDTLAVNAWLLANPGTPCVFYKHWQAYKKDIKLMIAARKMVRVNNQSAFTDLAKQASYVARSVKGANGSLLVVCGTGYKSYTVPAGYKQILEGHNYKYLVSGDCDTSSWEATVARIEEEEKEEPFDGTNATVYVAADFTPVFFYIWDSNNNTQLNGDWPGKPISATVTKFGKKWYTQTVPITSSKYFFNMVISQGYEKPQTSDINRINTDKYFECKLSGTAIQLVDVTDQYSNQ